VPIIDADFTWSDEGGSSERCTGRTIDRFIDACAREGSMSEFSIELAAERVDNARSREYFGEVLTSFLIGNTRSAMVMLWSVVVCDLVYKLQELRDLFNDIAATDILRGLQELQAKNPTSPDWERQLLDEVRKRTKLLEPADHQSLLHLQSRRHLCAHPVIGSADLLYRPTPEETRAAIRGALEATLLKPAVFAKGVVDEFLSDLAAKREFFPDDESLRRYLLARYFGRLASDVDTRLFRSLWKLSFQLVNPDTDAYRQINYRALTILFARDRARFGQCIELEKDFYSKVAPGEPLTALLDFLRHHPQIYKVLTDTARVPLESAARNDVSVYATAWFLSPSPPAHVKAVRERLEREPVVVSAEAWNDFLDDCRSADVLQEGIDCAVLMYVRSSSYDIADKRYVQYIESCLPLMSIDRLLSLVQGIEGNRQTFDRGRARLDHRRIRDAFAQRGGSPESLDPYTNFVRSCI
jgi:hypothetical protein